MYATIGRIFDFDRLTKSLETAIQHRSCLYEGHLDQIWILDVGTAVARLQLVASTVVQCILIIPSACTLQNQAILWQIRSDVPQSIQYELSRYVVHVVLFMVEMV